MAILTNEEKLQAYNEIVPIAQQFRLAHLPEHAKADTFRFLEEQMGYFILKFPAKNDKLSGFHIKKSEVHCIYINSAHNLGRQYFTAWHECYHAINNQPVVCLGDEVEADSLEEYKADCFAGCILMPENHVKKYIRSRDINLDYISYLNIILMQHFFGVSFSAVITRLIQVFPEHSEILRRRYSLGKIERAEELRTRTLEAHCSDDLIKPTNDVYVSSTFIDNIQFNLENNRITREMALSLMELIESIGSKDES